MSRQSPDDGHAAGPGVRPGSDGLDGPRLGSASTAIAGHRERLEKRNGQHGKSSSSYKDHEARAHRSALAFGDAAQATHFKSPRRGGGGDRRRTPSRCCAAVISSTDRSFECTGERGRKRFLPRSPRQLPSVCPQAAATSPVNRRKSSNTRVAPAAARSAPVRSWAQWPPPVKPRTRIPAARAA